MAFCTHCGAKLPDNHRFCTECGAAQPIGAPGKAAAQPVNPPVQQSGVPSEQTTYIPVSNGPASEHTTYIPKQERYTPPQQSYTPPQQSYTPPQQSYTPPQQSYTPPQQSYMPPQQSYIPPQQGYTIPQQQAPSGGSQPQPGFTMGAGKKKSGKGKGGLIVAIVLVLALIAGAVFFFVSGGMDLFGSKDEAAEVDESILGIYNAVSCIYEDEEQEVDDEWLELKKNGKGELQLDGDSFTFKWELDGEDLTIVQSGDEFTGTLEEGVIVLDINGMLYTYHQEGYEADQDNEEEDEDADAETTPVPAETAAPAAPVETEPEEDSSDPSSLQYWEGDWYGWWIINTVYEGDTDAEGNWWDCCASLVINDDGSATFLIWDEDTSKSSPLGRVDMEVSIVDGNVMEFISVSGEFWNQPIGYGDWTGRTDDDIYPEIMWFGSEYNNGEDLNFDYTFYMRPWGLSWEDIEADDPGLLPFYYEDWYLPLLDAGVTKAPSVIGE